MSEIADAGASVANPMVLYLSSLRTQEAGANPSYVFENRADFLAQLRRDAAWFPPDDALHIRTKLDGLIGELSKAQPWPKVVVLTGDAGDGKTAFCARFASDMGHAGELRPETSIGGWTIIKDASEIAEDTLVRILEEVEVDPDRRALIAINEGRLRRLARKRLNARESLCRDVIEPSLETWLSEADAAALDTALRQHEWLVLNFRHRFHVRVATPALLDAWTPAELWEDGPACGACAEAPRCPILANVESLREDPAREMLSDSLAGIHFAGQRLPLRRLQAVLALACTGGIQCAHVQDGPIREATPLDRLPYRFYSVLFARSAIRGAVRVEPEMLCRSLAPFDPGRHAQREVDRKLALRVMDDFDDAMELPPLESAALAQVQAIGRDSEGDAATLNAKLAALTRQVRRLRAFETGMAPGTWQSALRLLEGYARTGDESSLLSHLLSGLNALHRHPEKDDALVRRQLDPGGFREPARLALELDLGTHFESRLLRGPVLPESTVRPWLEDCPSDLYLVVSPAGDPSQEARLHLDTRLLTALLGSREGYVQLGALGSYRRDLARFFGHLVRIAAEREPGPRVILRRGDGRRSLDVAVHDGVGHLVLEVDE